MAREVRPVPLRWFRPSPTHLVDCSRRARDWPNNTLLSLETSLQLLSFDAAGYPAGVAAHLVHFLLRLSTLVSAPSLPSFLRSSAGSASRYARRPVEAFGDADARLEALQRQTAGRSAGGWSAWAWCISVFLVVLSFANSVYLVNQRRKYQLVLRKVRLAIAIVEPQPG